MSAEIDFCQLSIVGVTVGAAVSIKNITRKFFSFKTSVQRVQAIAGFMLRALTPATDRHLGFEVLRNLS